MAKADMTIRLATADDKKLWNGHVSHPLQSFEWGQFREKMGISVARIIEEVNGKVSSCWQLSFHPIPMSGRVVGYFPKGPAPTRSMVDALIRIGKQHRAVFIQMEPEISRTPEFHGYDALGLRTSHRPLFTKHNFLLDLKKSEEELMKAMHPKTRYNIRVAQKHGVRIAEDNSARAFDAYLALTRETTGRQAFYAHDETYHRTMWSVMHGSGIAHLFTATYEDEILAAWIIFTWHKTVYYPYGTSSGNHREVMAPTLLLWEIARHAKKSGMEVFDLWGALKTDADRNDPWYGFHRFKQGFSPDRTEYVGSYDLVIDPLWYRAYCLMDSLRWAALRLKAKR